ncbi:MAG: multiubiquitin domain-containing protein [Tepidisphaeraceae bacterium]|jgi:hypothetical protein
MALNESESGRAGDQVPEEIILVELVDIEEFGKRNEKPPRARKYRIRINKHHYVVDVSHMTGREILTLAGKIPPEKYKLQQKFHGGRVKTIQLDEVVDFTAHGVERFQTFPLTETEG